MEAEFSRYQQEINFLPPLWDEKNEVYYRFSYQEIPTIKENGQLEIYLSVMDKEFNLIGESLISNLNMGAGKAFDHRFPLHFAKDGKIWIYENINDELAFVVLTINKNS